MPTCRPLPRFSILFPFCPHGVGDAVLREVSLRKWGIGYGLVEPSIRSSAATLGGSKFSFTRLVCHNSFGEDSPGIRVRIYPDPDLSAEFLEFLKDPAAVKVLPVEYYKVDWLGFSGNPVNAHGVPA